MDVLDQADCSLFQVVAGPFYQGQVVAEKSKDDRRSFDRSSGMDLAGEIGVNHSGRQPMQILFFQAGLPWFLAAIRAPVGRDLDLTIYLLNLASFAPLREASLIRFPKPNINGNFQICLVRIYTDISCVDGRLGKEILNSKLLVDQPLIMGIAHEALQVGPVAIDP